MVGPGFGGRQNEKHQINGFLIQRIEVDRLVQACEIADHMIEFSKFGMWNCQTVPDAGGAQFFAFHQGAIYPIGVEIGGLGDKIGERLECLTFAMDIKVELNARFIDQVGPYPSCRMYRTVAAVQIAGNAHRLLHRSRRPAPTWSIMAA